MKQETIDCEFKREVNRKEWFKWCKTVVAFANTKGGKMLFGYNDDGSFYGIDNSDLDETIRFIEQIIQNHVVPFPQYEIGEYVSKGNKTAFSLIVSRRFGTATWLVNNGIPVLYVRRERSSVPATIEEMQNAILEISKKSYDLTPIGIKADLHSFSKLNEYFERANQGSSLIQNDLLSLNLEAADGYLTIAGALFMNQTKYQNANIVCNTWPSLTKGSDRITDAKSFNGSALEMFEFALNYIHSVSYYEFGGIKNGLFFDDEGSFSDTSLREAIINAIAHRDYQILGSEIIIDCYPDRVEITSPGSMLQDIDGSDSVPLKILPSARRNPDICRVFVKCRLMEERGSGFAKIIEDYKNMPEIFMPTFQYNTRMFTICLKNKKYPYNPEDIARSFTGELNKDILNQSMFMSRSKLYKDNDRFKKIEELLAKNPKSTYEQIQDLLGISKSGAKYYISSMKDACLIRRNGNNRSGFYEIVAETDRPCDFLSLDSDIQSRILSFCKHNFITSSDFLYDYDSDSYRQIIQKQTGTFITNGQFKGAMLLLGFKVENKEERYWIFNVSKDSPALTIIKSR